MKRTRTIHLALLSVLLSPMAANADLIGNTLEATACFPEICDDPGVSTIGGPVQAVVGAGPEFLDGQFGAFFGPTFDFDNNTLRITHANSSHTTANFNGYQFTDILSAIASFSAVSILSDTTGFFSGDPSRISFDSDNLWINFAGLSFGRETLVVLQFDFESQSVPEPGTLALLGLGLVGMAARRKKKV